MGSIQPAALLGVLQRHFTGKWMNVFQAVPVIHFITGESVFRGDPELSRRPESSRAGARVKMFMCMRSVWKGFPSQVVCVNVQVS